MRILLYNRDDVLGCYVKAKDARDVLYEGEIERMKESLRENKNHTSLDKDFQVMILDLETNRKRMFQDDLEAENINYVNLCDSTIKMRIQYENGITREFASNLDLMMEYLSNERTKLYCNNKRIDNNPKGYITKRYRIRHIA